MSKSIEVKKCISRSTVRSFPKKFFWKTLDGRPTNDPSKKVTWIHNDCEREIFRCWVCRNIPQNVIKTIR